MYPTDRDSDMNSIVLFPEDFINENTVCLRDRRHVHVCEILGSSAGDTLRAGLINGHMGHGRILKKTGHETILEVALTDPPPSPLPLTLILAMPRPKVFRKILRTVSSMGVKQIHVIRTWRVDKSYLDSPVLGKEMIQDELILGLEQARDTVLPSVEQHVLFRPFAEDELPEICRNTLCLAAHPGVERECPRAVDSPVTLAIGPEGGFVKFEIDMLSSIGFIPVTMGKRIMYTEAAIPAIIGRLF